MVIIGAGPAGLSAGTHLARAGFRVLGLDREACGGLLKKVAWYDNAPDHPGGCAGPELAEHLLARAAESGLELRLAEVEELERYSACFSISCTDGSCYTSSTVLIATGRRPSPLNVPGALEFRNRGVIDCVLCDAGLYRGRTVLVCGGGDTGVSEALTMARYADRVIVVEQSPEPAAGAQLRARAAARSNIEYRCATVLAGIHGGDCVTGVSLRDAADGALTSLPVDGVVAAVGRQPCTEFLQPDIELDAAGAVLTAADLSAGGAGLAAAGDVRSASALELQAALADGYRAAQTLERKLRQS